MREQFEARFPVPAGVQWSEEHQNYGWVKKSAFQQVITYRALFTGWKASRETLEIELPKPFGGDRMVSKAERYTRIQVIDEMHRTLEEAGLKVKPC